MDADIAVEAVELSPGQVRKAVRRRVCSADANAAAKRARVARADKRICLLAREDATASLYNVLPAEQAAACWQSLDDYARGRRADGDERSIQHIMCDTFVERLTGQSKADDVPVEIGVVISVDPHKRRFDGALRRLILACDQVCRMPVCEAPIRDGDHLKSHAQGGPTVRDNGHGLCERSHYCRDHPGWAIEVDPMLGYQRIIWITPTGHRYDSYPPPALGLGSLDNAALRRTARRRRRRRNRRRE